MRIIISLLLFQFKCFISPQEIFAGLNLYLSPISFFHFLHNVNEIESGKNRVSFGDSIQ